MAKALSLQTKKEPQKGSLDSAALLKAGRAHLRKRQYHVIKVLSGQDAVQALIKAGIMTPDGRLAKAYGEGPNALWQQAARLIRFLEVSLPVQALAPRGNAAVDLVRRAFFLRSLMREENRCISRRACGEVWPMLAVQQIWPIYLT